MILPLLTAVLVFIPGSNKVAKATALALSLLQLAVTLLLAFRFPSQADNHYLFRMSWMPEYGINFHLSIDGISLVMILLTNLLMPFIQYAGIHLERRREKLFLALMLFTQFALNGVFQADNAVLFYLFWEMALVPVFFILFLWGGERRQSVTLKFFIYALFGSLFLLVVFIYLYFQTSPPHSFEYSAFLNMKMEPCDQSWVFWLLLLSFVIKIPLFPVHTWQPDTYTVAPYQGSMLLGGLLMKMGIYGLIRWVVPVIPEFSLQWGYWIVLAALAGMVYFSVIALKQNNLKTFLAYSSLAHGGLMGAAVFSLNEYAIQGVLFQSVSHGIIIVLLFYFAQLIEERTDTLNMAHLGGIKRPAPAFAGLLLITVLASVGLPLTNGFVGELLMILGLFSFKVWTAFLGGLTLVLGAVYMLYAYQKVVLGPANELTETFSDIGKRELVMVVPLVLLVLLLGCYPQPLLQISEEAVRTLISTAYNLK